MEIRADVDFVLNETRKGFGDFNGSANSTEISLKLYQGPASGSGSIFELGRLGVRSAAAPSNPIITIHVGAGLHDVIIPDERNIFLNLTIVERIPDGPVLFEACVDKFEGRSLESYGYELFSTTWQTSS